VLQGSASESVLVSMLAARHRAFKTHRLSSSTRLVAYCSMLVSSEATLLKFLCDELYFIEHDSVLFRIT